MNEKMVNTAIGTGTVCTWLHRRQEPLCLLFFAGWGMDARPFAPLGAGGVDVCMLGNYRYLEAPQLPELRHYEELVVLAWSFGVWIAAQVLPWPLQAQSRAVIALGGTLQPVDARLGLAPGQFQGMLAGLDEEKLHSFYQAMFDEPAHATTFLANRPQQNLAALRSELEFLYNASLQSRSSVDIFTHRIITGRDRIFSGRNQARAWGREDTHSLRTMSWPHFPFYQFHTWGEVLATLLPEL